MSRGRRRHAVDHGALQIAKQLTETFLLLVVQLVRDAELADGQVAAGNADAAGEDLGPVASAEPVGESDGR